jgi:hypothetical protein
MTRPFPNPIEHAVVMVEVCGTVRAAREAAQVNWEFATSPTEFLYWIAVDTALEGACLAN